MLSCMQIVNPRLAAHFAIENLPELMYSVDISCAHARLAELMQGIPSLTMAMGLALRHSMWTV